MKFVFNYVNYNKYWKLALYHYIIHNKWYNISTMFYSYYDKVLEACIICTLIGDYQCVRNWPRNYRTKEETYSTHIHIYTVGYFCNPFPLQIPFLICIIRVWILGILWEEVLVLPVLVGGLWLHILVGALMAFCSCGVCD